jgi:hypothetical protein
VECCLATTKDAGPTTKDAGPTIYDAATHDAAPSAKDGSAASADGAPDSKLVSAATCAASPLGAGGQGFGWLFGLVAVTLGAVARRRRG